MSVLIVMLLALVFVWRVNMIQSHRNIFITACACSNTINIGLPINLALFGAEALPAVLVYYMGSTVVFWTLGHYLLASDARDMPKAPVFSLTTGKRILSPPICGFLAGLLLLVLGIKIPPAIGIAGSQIAGMTTPLSIICIGIAIYQTGLRNIRVSRDVGLIALGRFVVSPLVIIGLLYFFPVPEMMRNVFIIQSSLPPMSNIALLAIKYKSDSGFAAVSVSFGTLCALVTVPAFMVSLTSF
jgi:predicted permease